MPALHVGISGWTYPPWRGVFYPEGLAHRRELAYAAEHVGSIEVNGSFYALQKPDSYRRWRAETPEDFVFAVKGPRFVTHMKRLRDVRVPVANFLASGVLALGPRLGPLLWQLPPTLAFDADLFAEFVALLPRSTGAAARLAAEHDDVVPGDRALVEAEDDRPLRHAIEVRHPGFADPDVAAFLASVLTEAGVALVVADTAGSFPEPRTITADFVYVRLHGADELYVSGYTDDALDAWAERIRGWLGDGLDVHAYFDNDAKVHSPRDAQGLIRRLGAGRPVQ